MIIIIIIIDDNDNDNDNDDDAYYSLNIWNNIPLQIRKITNENHFKKEYKEYLFKLFCETYVFTVCNKLLIYLVHVCIYFFVFLYQLCAINSLYIHVYK